jgi:hypothetical protein
MRGQNDDGLETISKSRSSARSRWNVLRKLIAIHHMYQVIIVWAICRRDFGDFGFSWLCPNNSLFKVRD